ncbi:MAG: tetratricopeptide repeat protein [Candidatus Kerfeldbacteria bacterium]|nr:tetratricopeptide repeat protein [Candidatus Kerfeldbacteria bacterium]
MDPRTALALSDDYLELAKEYCESDDLDRATYYCQRSHQTLENAAAYVDEALIEMVRGRFDTAHDLLRTAIDVDPTYGNGWNNLGACLVGLGRPAEAIPYLQEALRVGYETPEKAFYNLGFAYEKLGEPEQARRQYEAALAAAPEYRLARQALDRLNEQEPRQP